MALADTLTAMGTAALTRSGGRPLGPHLFPMWPGARLAAQALPVRCVPGDNLAVHVAVAQAAPRTALVVDPAGDPDYGYVDGIIAVAARLRGIAGIVVDGCVRDVAAVARCGLPLVGTGVSTREPGHDAGGAVGEEVLMSGDPVPVPVRGGDWIVADDDGAVCLPRAHVSAIVAAALDVVSREQQVLDALSAGRSTLDVLNLDPTRVAGWEGSGLPSAGRAR
ncbi:RraA family protein [Marinactinospora rubrisoli]|uniref:Putative 4-hydroxy-4-methyl-2-oxoglutarate aldolase n=1 Tax=Marinactinospora rubrisoli TaxID=2715399 RepID=A0ABW2KF07_9ACTN